MESTEMVLLKLSAGQQWRCLHRRQTCGHWGGRSMHAKLPQSCPALATLWTVASQLLCVWDLPGEDTGTGCHAFFQENPPDPGIKPGLLHLPVLAGGCFTT